MADIRPFQGVHYNPAKVKDLSLAICPPYDIIDSRIQQELYQRSDYNFVRIDFGRELPQDSDTFNKYTRAANTFKTWLEQDILTTDKKPAIYVDEHSFTCDGRKKRRLSMTCLVKLEDWSKNIVRPHEGTLLRARSDRLNLLWALNANTSPIMALYDNKNNEISGVLNTQVSGKPAMTVPNAEGENHRIWAITDAEAIEHIRKQLSDQPLYIADGHHRYESALVYQRERHSSSPSDKEEPYDFTMMTLVDVNEPGLVILPSHRLIRGIEQTALDSLLARLVTFFKIEEYKIKANVKSQVSSLLKGNEDDIKMILCGIKPDHIQVISLLDFKLIRPMFPAFHSEAYQKLDVSIVDHIILEELLGLTHDKAGTFLDYSYDAETTIEKIRNKEYQLGIIVNPVKPEVIKAVADSGDRMPRKSTYFYPKVPAGLVSYSFT